MFVRLFVIDSETPAILIALNPKMSSQSLSKFVSQPYHERLGSVDSCAFKWFSLKFLGFVLCEGPSLYNVSVKVNQNVESFLTSVSGKDDLEVFLGLLWDGADNHESVTIVSAEI